VVQQVIDHQVVPTPFLVYFCDLQGRFSGRGGMAQEFVQLVWGTSDAHGSRSHWERLGVGDQYQLLQDSMKQFFAEGAEAVNGSVAQADAYLAKYSPPATRRNINEDQLVLEALGKKARDTFRKLDKDSAERQEIRRAAVCLFSAWLYLAYALIGEQTKVLTEGAAMGLTQNPATGAALPPTTSTVLNPGEVETLQRLLGDERYQKLEASGGMRIVVEEVRTTQRRLDAGSMSDKDKEKILQRMVESAYIRATTTFSRKEIFGSDEGQGLDADTVDRMTNLYMNTVDVLVRAGSSLESAKKAAQRGVAFQLKNAGQDDKKRKGRSPLGGVFQR
jgi:hypothetical protein